MTKFDFTEGKWEVIFCEAFSQFEILSNNELIAIIPLSSIILGASRNYKANARLISKSPEMLKALIEYVKFIKDLLDTEMMLIGSKVYKKIVTDKIKLIEDASGKTWAEIIK